MSSLTLTYFAHNHILAFDISNTTKLSGVDNSVIILFEKYVNRFQKFEFLVEKSTEMLMPKKIGIEN